MDGRLGLKAIGRTKKIWALLSLSSPSLPPLLPLSSPSLSLLPLYSLSSPSLSDSDSDFVMRQK